jgi:hypothetical protein
MNRTRRGFLADVGAGMFVAGIGPALATIWACVRPVPPKLPRD